MSGESNPWIVRTVMVMAVCLFGFIFLSMTSSSSSSSSSIPSVAPPSPYLQGYQVVRDANLLESGAYNYYLPSPKKDEFGHYSWTIFHSYAAHFPEKPTAREQEAAVQFFHAIPELFPCKECAGHFRQLLAQMPVRASSRDELSLWLCEAHNVVNKRLKKPIFNCAKVIERWGGDCGCNNETPKEETKKEEIEENKGM